MDAKQISFPGKTPANVAAARKKDNVEKAAEAEAFTNPLSRSCREYGLLFEQIAPMDLERIVCKRKDSPYKTTEKPLLDQGQELTLQPIKRT
jgi:hypothetical protein